MHTSTLKSTSVAISPSATPFSPRILSDLSTFYCYSFFWIHNLLYRRGRSIINPTSYLEASLDYRFYYSSPDAVTQCLPRKPNDRLRLAPPSTSWTTITTTSTYKMMHLRHCTILFLIPSCTPRHTAFPRKDYVVDKDLRAKSLWSWWLVAPSGQSPFPENPRPGLILTSSSLLQPRYLPSLAHVRDGLGLCPF